MVVEDRFYVRPGLLTSVGEVSKAMSGTISKIAEYSDKEIMLDLTNLVAGQINDDAVALLIIYLAKIKSIVGSTPSLVAPHSVIAQTYLNSLDFFRIVDKYNLLYVHPGTVGMFTNRHRRSDARGLFFFPYDALFDSSPIQERHIQYKRVVEKNFPAEILNTLKKIGIDSYRIMNMIIDLVHNSWVHGLSDCCVSISSHSRFVSISVIDLGKGFASTVREKRKISNLGDLESLVFASLCQENVDGIRFIIDDLCDEDIYARPENSLSHVTISSDGATLRYNSRSWGVVSEASATGEEAGEIVKKCLSSLKKVMNSSKTHTTFMSEPRSTGINPTLVALKKYL